MPRKKSYFAPSFSLPNQLRRVVWNTFYLFLFKYSPRTLHSWRRFLLRIFGAKVSEGVRVYPKVSIWAPWNLVLKKECVIGNGVVLYSQGMITIGLRATVSPGAHLCTGTHDYSTAGFPLLVRPIAIGDYSWIAAEVFIHPGITIDEGCVVGARSVVTKNMPEWMVCAGNPCKPLKIREMDNKNEMSLIVE